MADYTFFQSGNFSMNEKFAMRRFSEEISSHFSITESDIPILYFHFLAEMDGLIY